MSTPTYNLRQIEKILKYNGFTFFKQTGGHRIYKNNSGNHVSIGISNCNKMVFQRLIKENKLEIKKKGSLK